MPQQLRTNHLLATDSWILVKPYAATIAAAAPPPPPQTKCQNILSDIDDYDDFYDQQSNPFRDIKSIGVPLPPPSPPKNIRRQQIVYVVHVDDECEASL
ncbi:MAG: hypothetical protein R3E39_28995 [Anaerolineae bacterium]